MTSDCEDLLVNVLECSDKFIKRMESLAMFKIDSLLWLFLGVHHNKEPDFCDLLDILHHKDDEMDGRIGAHELQEDFLRLFPFFSSSSTPLTPDLARTPHLTAKPIFSSMRF